MPLSFPALTPLASSGSPLFFCEFFSAALRKRGQMQSQQGKREREREGEMQKGPHLLLLLYCTSVQRALMCMSTWKIPSSGFLGRPRRSLSHTHTGKHATTHLIIHYPRFYSQTALLMMMTTMMMILLLLPSCAAPLPPPPSLGLGVCLHFFPSRNYHDHLSACAVE